MSMQTDSAKALQAVGFCPQFSAIWDNITVQEHLVLYARLNGYRGAAGVDRAWAFMDQMGIASYSNVRAKALSGGTQRKLSVAIALIGDPLAIFLDEPSGLRTILASFWPSQLDIIFCLTS